MSTTLKTKFLILSDTHGSKPEPEGARSSLTHPFPKADVVIHCGDLSMSGRLGEYEATISVLESIDADLKLVIAGNHDVSLDVYYYLAHKGSAFTRVKDEDTVRKARELWAGERAKRSGIRYLEEGLYTFDLTNGARMKVYASPFQPEFYDWAFMYERHQDRFNPPEAVHAPAESIAEQPIPDFPAVDVVVTHGPALGHLDETYNGDNAGCPHLLKALRRARPKLHCCGHIHEGWGAQKIRWGENDSSDKVIDMNVDFDRAAMADVSRSGNQPLDYGKETLLVNASIMNLRYQPIQDLWLVDIDLPRVQADDS